MSCFVSLDAAFYYSTFYDLLKCLIKTFAAVSIPQGIGNLLSLLECLKENIIKKGWAWFKLTTREFRWDQIWIKVPLLIKGSSVWVKRSNPTTSIKRVFPLFWLWRYRLKKKIYIHNACTHVRSIVYSGSAAAFLIHLYIGVGCYMKGCSGIFYTTKGRDRFHWASTPLKPYKVGYILLYDI